MVITVGVAGITGKFAWLVVKHLLASQEVSTGVYAVILASYLSICATLPG
jgi:hypothetical protein